MRYIIDSTLFFTEFATSGAMFTTPSVIAELRDLRSKGRYETLLAGGLTVCPPSFENRKRVTDAAARTGDIGRLSETDTDLLTLALDLDGTLITDDFAVQNVAHALDISVQPVRQRRAKRRTWKFRCTGCRQYADGPGDCPVCGAQIKRTIK